MSWQQPHLHTALVPYDPNARAGRVGAATTMTTFRMEAGVPFDASAHRRQQHAIGVRQASTPTPTYALGVTASDTSSRRRGQVAVDDCKQTSTNDIVRAMHMSVGTMLFACGCLWLTALIFMGFVYMEITAGIERVHNNARPYLHFVMNHTMNMLDNADHASVGMSEAVDDVTQVTHSTVPAVQYALNQTTSIVSRLEALAAHPVLRLSLGND